MRQTLGWQPHAVSAPASAAQETAAGLAALVQIEPQLRDCDYGSWAGRSMAEIQAGEAEAFAHWLADPAAAPHGGESLADVDRRLRGWLAARSDARAKTIAVVPAFVVRALVVAALDLPPRLFWSLDAAPLGISRLSAVAGRWRLGSFNAPP